MYPAVDRITTHGDDGKAYTAEGTAWPKAKGSVFGEYSIVKLTLESQCGAVKK